MVGFHLTYEITIQMQIENEYEVYNLLHPGMLGLVTVGLDYWLLSK